MNRIADLMENLKTACDKREKLTVADRKAMLLHTILQAKTNRWWGGWVTARCPDCDPEAMGAILVEADRVRRAQHTLWDVTGDQEHAQRKGKTA